MGSSLRASNENSNNEVVSAKYKSVVLQTMETNPSNEQRPCVVPPTYGVTDHEISSHVNTLQRLSDNNNRPVAQIFSRPQGEPFQSNPPALNKVSNVSKVAGMLENSFSPVEGGVTSNNISRLEGFLPAADGGATNMIKKLEGYFPAADGGLLPI